MGPVASTWSTQAKKKRLRGRGGPSLRALSFSEGNVVVLDRRRFGRLGNGRVGLVRSRCGNALRLDLGARDDELADGLLFAVLGEGAVAEEAVDFETVALLEAGEVLFEVHQPVPAGDDLAVDLGVDREAGDADLALGVGELPGDDVVGDRVVDLAGDGALLELDRKSVV